jgi:exopolyphosphatase/guanosine-5'-triphosphate,3'-diphosphate pyrophosphatase
VRSAAVRITQRALPYNARLAFGSSGTIENLAAVAARVIHKRQPLRHETLTQQDLRQVVTLLCMLPLEERRKVPGLAPERADIIIAGAAILETLLQEMQLPAIHFSDRGLREGLLVDYLIRNECAPAMQELSARELSVLRLGRICNFDEQHANHVCRLATELFDSAQACGLHRLGAWERELLDWAGQLHDVGTFLSYANHHAHSYYFIRNADLLGFDQTELAIIATTALFHRKVFPRKRHAEFAALDPRAQQIVRVLCTLLRIAESLDRSHAGLVKDARFRLEGSKYLALEISGQNTQLEVWGVQVHHEAVDKVFGKKLVVRTQEEA